MNHIPTIMYVVNFTVHLKRRDLASSLFIHPEEMSIDYQSNCKYFLT